MKYFILCLLICCMISCGDNPSYLQTTVSQKARAQKVTLEKVAQQAVHVYKVENNIFPESLDDVPNFPELPKEQKKWYWDYNPETGVVKIAEE
ncbi:MAG: hypothetical protein KBC30_07125 [Planctomycetes bacterium]|nr:hypothetical protein [Planctomycetota bacterium]HPY75548.1 hypothetical protein [Planctomycetota bacterium]HQB01453.1 hypothetical protein [Planctomycetota bacterium]